MRKFKKMIAFIGLIGFLTIGIGSISIAAEINLRYAGNLPVGTFVTRGQEYFAKLVEERTGGRVKISVYPAAQLFSDKDMVKAIPSGAVDIGQVTLSMWTGVVPGLLVFDLPYFFKDDQHVWRALDGEAGNMLKKEMEKVGIKALYWIDGSFSDFFSKEPLRTLEDFKGKRIRNFGGLTAESITAMGAASVFLGGGEVYMGLQRGTIDGAITVWPSLCDRKFFEVTKYVTSSNYTPITYGSFMNLKKWNELPSDIQKIILECASAAQEWGRKEISKESQQCTAVLKEKGVQIYVVPEAEKEKWRKANKPVIETFIKKSGEKGKLLMELVEKVR
jgi:tripartite ATP-independent transporter DctP family solute receptor